jgi:hypothetical protein
LILLGVATEALSRFQEGEQLLKRHEARGHVSGRGWAITDWVEPVSCSAGSTTRKAWATARSEPPRAKPGSRPMRGTYLGDIAIHPDRFDPESGEAHYRQALALAEPRGMRPLVAQCHLGLGKLYRRTGRREQAQEHLTTATTMYREMGMTYWREKAEAEMRELA